MEKNKINKQNFSNNLSEKNKLHNNHISISKNIIKSQHNLSSNPKIYSHNIKKPINEIKTEKKKKLEEPDEDLDDLLV